MTAYGYDNGHLVAYDKIRQQWGLATPAQIAQYDGTDLTAPSDEVVVSDDVCPHCGKHRTPEGYDGCLGHIEGAIYACCGHGQEPGYVTWEDGTRDVLPMKGPMDRFMLIEHHGGMVWTRTALEGLYPLHCLCTDCAKFTPEDRENNCPIANALYALCVEHNIVTPVWECPDFEALT